MKITDDVISLFGSLPSSGNEGVIQQWVNNHVVMFLLLLVGMLYVVYLLMMKAFVPTVYVGGAISKEKKDEGLIQEKV